MYKESIKREFIKLIKTDITKDIISNLMNRFDNEIVIFEDLDDPMRPSLCREEFERFLRESIENNIKIETRIDDVSITFGIGDKEKLGLGEKLDINTTDCIKIIGTILNGIVGEYVLVSSEMTGKPEGRTGRAEIWTREGYDRVALTRGWDPDKPSWRFSNFPGIPDFWDVDLNMDKHIDKLIKELK